MTSDDTKVDTSGQDKGFTADQLAGIAKHMPITPELLHELSKEGGLFGASMRMELKEQFPSWRPKT